MTADEHRAYTDFCGRYAILCEALERIADGHAISLVNNTDDMVHPAQFARNALRRAGVANPPESPDRSRLMTEWNKSEEDYIACRKSLDKAHARAEAERDALQADLDKTIGYKHEAEAERDRLREMLVERGDSAKKGIEELHRLRKENEALRSLVDGAEDVVELWGHATIHNGQREWAKGWLAKARQLIRAKGGGS